MTTRRETFHNESSMAPYCLCLHDAVLMFGHFGEELFVVARDDDDAVFGTRVSILGHANARPTQILILAGNTERGRERVRTRS